MIQITIWYGEILRPLSLSFALVIVCTDKHNIPYMSSNKTSWLFSNKMKNNFQSVATLFAKNKEKEQKRKEEQNVRLELLVKYKP